MEFWCLAWQDRLAVWLVVWATWVSVTDPRGVAGSIRRFWASVSGRVPRRAFRVAAAAGLLVAWGALAGAQPVRGVEVGGIPVERLRLAESVFDPEVLNLAELYRDPPRRLVPVAFGRVSFERRSMLRTVSSSLLIAVSGFGLVKALEGRSEGVGWGQTGVLLGVSTTGAVSGLLGATKWSHVRQVRRVGW